MHCLSKVYSDYTSFVIHGFIKQFVNSFCPFRILNGDYNNVFPTIIIHILFDTNGIVHVPVEHFNDVITLVYHTLTRGSGVYWYQNVRSLNISTRYFSPVVASFFSNIF